MKDFVDISKAWAVGVVPGVGFVAAAGWLWACHPDTLMAVGASFMVLSGVVAGLWAQKTFCDM